LREQVERLLKALSDAGEFLEQGLAEVKMRSALPGEKPGDRIGHYKLLEQIGEGGYQRYSDLPGNTASVS
jgi:hypothetical protein